MRAPLEVLLALLVAAAAAYSAAAGGRAGGGSGSSSLARAALSTELATLASEGDALRLWQRATASAADAVVEALRRQDAAHTVQLKDIDLEELRIWHGQSVSLGLEADGQRYSFMVQSEPEWQRLASVLGTAEGGLLPRHDWESLDRDWLSPVRRGSQLQDFALEGPVDVFLAQPTALQLFLPHASDAGTVKRILLREGAAVLVRGARSVRLRRGVDLPAIGLSEFAGIVTADAAQQQPLGVLHLLAGVQAAAQAHWNASHPDQSLGLVALDIDFSPSGAALLAAPTAGGGVRRLRARRVSEGAIELLPRDGPPAGSQAAAAANAVALRQEAEAADGPWPLKSVHPAQLQSYEKLLRQVITSRLFRTGPGGGGGGGALQGLRVAQDVALRLVETEAEATTLVQMRLELDRRPKLKPAAQGGSGKQAGSSSGGGEGGAGSAVAVAEGDAESGGAGEAAAGGGRLTAAAYLALLDDPPDTLQVLTGAATRQGPHETWTATVQIKGDAQRGTLKFVPLHLQRVDAASDSVQFAPAAAFTQLLGLGNGTSAGQVVMLA
ncbi:hypothetical protein ABPG75_012530 [Micractinium tetrahymenae]